MKHLLLLIFSFFVQWWRESNVSVIVYGVKHKAERDYFVHLGCPVIVDNVRELAQIGHD